MSAEQLAHLKVLFCLVFWVPPGLLPRHSGVQTRMRKIVLLQRVEQEEVILSLAGLHHLLQGQYHPAIVLDCRMLVQMMEQRLVLLDVHPSS